MQTTVSSGHEFYDEGYIDNDDDQDFDDRLDFGSVPFCGRQKELDELKQVWRAAIMGNELESSSPPPPYRKIIPKPKPIAARAISEPTRTTVESTRPTLRAISSKQASLKNSQRKLLAKAAAKAALKHGSASTMTARHHHQSLADLEFSQSGSGDDGDHPIEPALQKASSSSKKPNVHHAAAPPVAIVSGFSGTGKTALVERFLSELDPSATVLRGRFTGDQQQYSAILQALTAYFRGDSKRVDYVRKSLTTQELRILGNILPGVISSPEPSSSKPPVGDAAREHKIAAQRKMSLTASSIVGNEAARIQTSKVLLHTISAICNRDDDDEMPVLLCLDDLQRADSSSMALIADVMAEVRRIVFLGCAQADQMDSTVRLIKKIRGGGRVVRRIELLNLSLEETNAYVASILKLPAEETHPLTCKIYDKTRGNLMFTNQSLEALESSKAIFFSVITFRWEWSHTLEGIVELADKLPDNVADAVAGKLNRAPERLKRVLAVAAYARASALSAEVLLALLTSRVDEGVQIQIYQPPSYAIPEEDLEEDDDEDDSSEICAETFANMTKDELVKLLDVAVLEGHLSNRMGSDVYEFAHDRIQQAAYDMVEAGPSRQTLRTRIGKALYKLGGVAPQSFGSSVEPYNNDWMLFVAADHINAVVSEKGIQNTDSGSADDDLRLDSIFLAELNFQVGLKAVNQATFLPALKYLQNSSYAIQSIPHHWKTNYRLSLQIFRSLSDVQLVLGNFKIGNKLAQQILDHSESLYDMLPTYLSLASALGRQECHLEAFELLREALVVSHEFPQRFLVATVVKEQMSMKMLLRKNSDYDILLLPIMTNEDKMAAMRCLSECCTRAYQCGCTNEFLMCVLRMIKITFKHGLCGETAHAFAAFGLYLFGPGDDQESGVRLARLARRVLDHTRAKHMESLVISLVCLHIDAWNTPHSQILESLQRAHQVGLEVGDLEGGFRCLLNCNYHAYSAGYPLGPVEDSGAELEEQLRQYKMNSLIGIMQEVRLPVQFFLGYIPIPLNWFDLMTIDADSEDASDTYRLIQGFIGRLEICIHFGQYRVAERIVPKLEQVCEHDSSYLITTGRLLYSGLMATGMFRETGQSKYKALATKYTKEMKRLTRARGLNAFHKYLLMHADFEASCGGRLANSKLIRSAFDRAIADACEIGSTHIAALGSQLAGEYFLRTKSATESSRPHMYFSQASDYYDEWGAAAKVEHLEEKYQPYLGQSVTRRMKGGSTNSATRASDRSVDLKFLSSRKPRIHDDLSLCDTTVEGGGRNRQNGAGSGKQCGGSSRNNLKQQSTTVTTNGDEVSCLTMDAPTSVSN